MEAEAGEVDPPGRAAGGANRGQHRVRVAGAGWAGGGVLRGDKMRRHRAGRTRQQLCAAGGDGARVATVEGR
jgi:hypothetical protein